MSTMTRLRACALALSLLPAAPVAFAAGGHGDGHGHGHGKGPDIGKPGVATDVTRTIGIIMRDNLYEPETLEIREGETVRFTVRNEGEFVHEFNIGTATMHAAHQEEMMGMMESGMLEPDRINHAMMNHGSHGMKHDDPNSVLLEPGQSAEIIWTFPDHARLEFACNVPGHYQTGMVGSIRLKH
ncbi:MULTISPECIES: plastocyanin/azurin family copper-binding protein [unclassified Minwuia]|uniref:cupredoxin domain-containing protein n=1 Tax=unclassified Minwuia TaxID=2618799 RepID=UPI00247A6943|nr:MULTISPECIES: plastocyanin/azurin family copper-binding protein [unclassified Minwuia]